MEDVQNLAPLIGTRFAGGPKVGPRERVRKGSDRKGLDWRGTWVWVRKYVHSCPNEKGREPKTLSSRLRQTRFNNTVVNVHHNAMHISAPQSLPLHGFPSFGGEKYYVSQTGNLGFPIVFHKVSGGFPQGFLRFPQGFLRFPKGFLRVS